MRKHSPTSRFVSQAPGLAGFWSGSIWVAYLVLHMTEKWGDNLKSISQYFFPLSIDIPSGPVTSMPLGTVSLYFSDWLELRNIEKVLVQERTM